MTPPLTYAAVTPARDEEDNLRRLAACMVAQTVRPAAWVIAENGSADGTAQLARQLAAAHPWITVIGTRAAASYDRTSPYMRAFHAGVDALAGAGDVVVKLDADVSMDSGFFEGMLAAFASDPRLGIASGTLFELDGSKWREIVLLGAHCWGPTRAYRRSCLDTVLPLDDGIGYASIDEVKAQLAGFTTRTLSHLPFRHHRPEGAGEGSRWRSWSSQGAAAHYTGYRPSYLLARSAYRMRRDPAALALVTGYLACAIRRAPRHHDQRVIGALRDQQRVRRLPAVVGGRISRARTSG